MIPIDRSRVWRLWMIWSAITLVFFLACGILPNAISALVRGRSVVAQYTLLVVASAWLGLSALSWPMIMLWVKWSREASTPFPGYAEPISATTCAYCGYDLAGLAKSTTCPECGNTLKRPETPR